MEIRPEADTCLGRVRFKVGRNDIVSLVGDNGTGKTTVLRQVVGKLPHRRGEVLVNGMRDWVNEINIGYVAQRPAYLRRMTVKSALRMCRAVSAVGTELKETAVERLGVGDFEGHEIGTLSTGQRRLVQIALGITCGEGLLLVDEPFWALEGSRMGGVLEAFESLSRGGWGILITEHLVSVAGSVADRVVPLGKRLP